MKQFSDDSTGFPGMKKLATNGLFRSGDFLISTLWLADDEDISNESLFSYKLRIRKRRSNWRKETTKPDRVKIIENKIQQKCKKC